MSEAVPKVCASMKVFQKHQVNWNTVCGAIRICPGVTFCLLTILLRFRTNICPSWYDVMYQPRSSVWITRISLGLLINAGLFLGLEQEGHFRWTRDCSRVNWEEFAHCHFRANGTYSVAKHQFCDENRAILMNVQFPHKWWSTLKSAVFGSISSLPLLVSEGGGLCVSRLLRLICCRIILTASSPGSLLIWCSLAIHLLVLPPLPSGRERSGISC